MPDRPIDAKVGGAQQSTANTVADALKEEDVLPPDATDEQRRIYTARKKAEYKHRIASVLDRGFTIDRLTVNVPPDLWQEWVPNTPQDIARAKLLGFVEDTKYAVNRALHDGGDGTSRVGDVISMVQPMWMHEVIEEEKQRLYRETHLKKRQKEEKDYEAFNKALDVPTMVGSDMAVVPGTQLTEVMDKVKAPEGPKPTQLTQSK